MTYEELIKAARSKEFSDCLANVNRWDLLPALFRVKGKPFSLKGREQFSVLFSDEMVRETIVLSGRQEGKCSVRTKKDDFLALRDYLGIRIDTSAHNIKADRVASESMSSYVSGQVSSWMSPGVKPILRITTSMGNIIRVTAEHKVRTFNGYVCAGDLRVGSRVATMRRCYSFGIRIESDYRIAITAYFIGDGRCGQEDGKGNFELTVRRQVSDHVMSLCNSLGEDVRIRNDKKGIVDRIGFRSNSPIRRYLMEDGLAGRHSHDKFIPDWVFELDERCTRMFVESLWSTDGNTNVSGNGVSIEYSSASPLLASDLRALLSKFGIATSIRVKKSGYKKNGVYVPCRDSYIIRVYGYKSQKIFLDTFSILDRDKLQIHVSSIGQDDRSNRDTIPEEGLCLIGALADYLSDDRRPGKSIRGRSLSSVFEIVGSEVRRKPKYPISRFKLSKYLEAFKMLGLEDKPEYLRLKEFADADVMYDRVVSIEKIGKHPTFDVEVSEAHNFILNNICVHNSMSLSRSDLFDLLSIPNFQILYVAPLQEQARRYSDLYFNEAIQSCPLAMHLQESSMAGVMSDAKIIKATGHQSFANGSGIQLTYAKTSADRVRGVTADRISFDEVQDIGGDTIPIIQESLTSSEYGCSRYTGTAKVVENLIEAKWQKSSMCEWVMKCQHCGYYNIPNLDGKVLSMIQADGMHCLHCDRRLDVSVGQWVAAYPDRMKTFRGYHIPQVVCPFIVNNKNNWDKLLHKLMNGVLATFIQENLGISYSVGQRLLTMQHIRRQCTLPTTKRLQELLKENPARYSFIVAGVDWGGAELSSFTVITVIGIRPNGRIDVLWARRYRGFDPDEQMTDIAHICRFYRVTACFCDAGMGLDKNQILMKRFGLPIVQMQYTRQLKLFGKNRSSGRTNVVQCWTIDKVMALDVLFLAIRNRRIFFPNEESFISTYTPDLLSPYESTTEVGGLTHRLYLRSESQPDDFCHALCFASMGAMKLLGLAIDDMIPADAFGGGMTDADAPEDDRLDPHET